MMNAKEIMMVGNTLILQKLRLDNNAEHAMVRLSGGMKILAGSYLSNMRGLTKTVLAYSNSIILCIW